MRDFAVLFILFFSALMVLIVYKALKARKEEEARMQMIRQTVYSQEFMPIDQFESNWIIHPNSKYQNGMGLKYEDGPGCYIITIYSSPVTDGHFESYDNIYVGQSVKVYQRVHNHLNGKGQGDVYADRKNGKYLYVQIIRCDASELSTNERNLIAAFHATDSYNKTRGG